MTTLNIVDFSSRKRNPTFFAIIKGHSNLIDLMIDCKSHLLKRKYNKVIASNIYDIFVNHYNGKFFKGRSPLA